MSSKPVRSVAKGENRRLRLNGNLEKHILAYATAAGAALLSTVLPAEAEVVYTPSNIPIAEALFGQPVFTPLDLNNDGVVDFSFENFFSATSSHSVSFLRIVASQTGNETAAVPSKEGFTAAAVPSGKQIGPQGNFQAGGLYMAIQAIFDSIPRSSGSWLQVETSFVGLKFLINGQVHYGWARVKLPSPGTYYLGSIYGYAYESTPNQPIVAGQTSGTAEKPVMGSEPAGLGVLAAGSSGLSFWRAQRADNGVR
jgi:hypothetical protein